MLVRRLAFYDNFIMKMQFDIIFIDEALSHAILLMTFLFRVLSQEITTQKIQLFTHLEDIHGNKSGFTSIFPTNICIKEVRCMDVSEGLLVVVVGFIHLFI